MLNPTGHTASPSAIAAVGGASTSWMIDPDRDLTVVFLSAGFIEGLSHISRGSASTTSPSQPSTEPGA